MENQNHTIPGLEGAPRVIVEERKDIGLTLSELEKLLNDGRIEKGAFRILIDKEQLDNVIAITKEIRGNVGE